MSSKNAIYFEPENGWHSYNNSAEILNVIWENLSEENGEWKYMNPMSDVSIWEYQRDGSYIWIGFDLNPDEKITELYATQTQAVKYLNSYLGKFNLRKTQ